MEQLTTEQQVRLEAMKIASTIEEGSLFELADAIVAYILQNKKP